MKFWRHCVFDIDRSWWTYRDANEQRWISTSLEPLHRPRKYPPVSSLHPDLSFPNYLSGKTVKPKGIIALHEGKVIRQQIANLKALHLNRR